MPDIDQPATAAPSSGPVGQGDYEVRSGDCISSIAKDHGYFWQTLWDDPANAELRGARKDPNVLLPGDRVAIPDKQRKEEPGATEMRHRFRRKGEPGVLRLVIRELGEPRANAAYVLKADLQEWRGSTDPNGQLEVPLASNARRATLTVGEGEEQDEFILQLGALDPLDTMSGVQGRLKNLGYDVGSVDGVLGPKTAAVLAAFCGDHDLAAPPAGEVPAQVRERLRTVHGF